MAKTRVSALNQLISPGGTTRDLGINFRAKMLARALEAQQAQEGILTSRARRAELAGLPDFRSQLLDLEQSKLNQAGALGFGGLDLQGRGLDLQKTLGERGLAFRETEAIAEREFRGGAGERTLELERGRLELGREFESPIDALLREALGGTGGGFAPTQGAPAATTAELPAPAPRRPQGRGAFFAKGDAATVNIPAPGETSLRPGDARFGPDVGIGGARLDFPPGAFDVQGEPTIENLIDQQEATKMGRVVEGVDKPGTVDDAMFGGLSRNKLVQFALASKLGIPLSEFAGTRASEVQGRAETLEDFAGRRELAAAQSAEVGDELESLLARGRPEAEELGFGRKALGVVSPIAGVQNLLSTAFSRQESRKDFGAEISEIAATLEERGFDKNTIIRTIRQWARDRVEDGELDQDDLKAIQEVLKTL